MEGMRGTLLVHNDLLVTIYWRLIGKLSLSWVSTLSFGSKIVSAIVSFFTSTYIMKWKEFLPHKEMMYPPSFDGRAVCYLTYEILRDYLS